jgi:hypothetical protein
MGRFFCFCSKRTKERREINIYATNARMVEWEMGNTILNIRVTNPKIILCKMTNLE